MKIFLAGAAAMLNKARSATKSGLRSQLSARPVVADALNRDAVARPVAGVGPEAVIHQLAAINNGANLRNPDKDFAATNRLRTEGLDILLDTAVDAGARRFVAQSYTGWCDEHEKEPPMPTSAKRRSCSVPVMSAAGV
jgi:nucleoside-diphosphate-sugar epimerase